MLSTYLIEACRLDVPNGYERDNGLQTVGVHSKRTFQAVKTCSHETKGFV